MLNYVNSMLTNKGAGLIPPGKFPALSLKILPPPTRWGNHPAAPLFRLNLNEGRQDTNYYALPPYLFLYLSEGT